MSEKLKILVVAQTPPALEGQSIMTQYLLEGRYEGIELHQAPASMADGPEAGRAPSSQLIPTLKLIFQIAKARRCQRPGALYFSPSPTTTGAFLRDCVILIATRRMFPKVVFHLHTGGLAAFHARLSGPLRTLFRLAYDRPDVAISTNRNVMQDAELLHARENAVVAMGIPDVWPDGPRRYKDPVPTIVFTADVCEENGVGELIDACKILQAKGVKFHCKISGQASSEAELAKFREQSSELGGVVTFKGPVTGDARWDLLAESDVFCLPAHLATGASELGTFEAMMSGLPVVAANSGSLSEIVMEGKTGFLTPVRDPRATADKLARLLRDSILRQVMGNAARNRFLGHYRVDVFREGMEAALGLLREAKSLKP